MLRGPTIAAAPSTRVTLVMLDPTALPMPISPLPAKDAIAETSISGAEVPNATTVSPMTIRLTPEFAARPAAPYTKRSAPQTTAMKPAIIAAIA